MQAKASAPSTADHIGVTRTTSNQPGVTAGTDLVLNSVSSSSGGIAYNSTTGVFTLKAGVKYDLRADLAFNLFTNTTTGFIAYEWVDASTNSVLPGTVNSIVSPPTRTANESGQPFAGGIYTPTTNQQIKIRVRSASGSADMRTALSSASIIQIGSSPAVGANPLNRYARFVKTLPANVTIPAGGLFDMTPDVQQSNTFPAGVLAHDAIANALRTANTTQLNLQIRVLLTLDSGALAVYDVALQRGNETVPIETTKMPLFRRPTTGGAVGGSSAVVINTFTSGASDPFNQVGFKIIFFNATGQNIDILAGQIRVDIFGVS
jgi:hypothetical protein